MFQFTTTNVVNTPFWNGYKGDLGTYDVEKEDPNSLITASEGHFYVKGVNDFLTENITAIYRAKAREAQNASVTFDFTPVTANNGDVFRLNLYIGLSQGSNNAMYANDLYFKGKPFLIEFAYKTNWKTTLEKLEKTINKLGLEFEGEKVVDIDINGTDKTLTITAVNEYQRFKVAEIEKLNREAYNGVGDWEETDVTVERVEGIEGFGTYNWILHNLRIPTAARNDMFGQNYEETPVVGGTYDQYTIHYCKNRGSLGLNAVGDQTMSHTTHVFYVLSSGCEGSVSDIFESGIEKAFGSGKFVSEEINEEVSSFPEGYTSPVEKFDSNAQ